MVNTQVSLCGVTLDNPVIPARYLSGSSAQENAELHLLVERVPMEQMLKIWNNTSKEYKLSFVLMVTGVTIASKRKRQVTRITDFEVSINPETHESLVQRSVSAVLRLRDELLRPEEDLRLLLFLLERDCAMLNNTPLLHCI